MDSQTTDIRHFAVVFHYDVTIKAPVWKHYEIQPITYDITAKNNDEVRDVRSLAYKIKVLNGCVPGT